MVLDPSGCQPRMLVKKKRPPAKDPRPREPPMRDPSPKGLPRGDPPPEPPSPGEPQPVVEDPSAPGQRPGKRILNADQIAVADCPAEADGHQWPA
jgi:hypothetical protein